MATQRTNSSPTSTTDGQGEYVSNIRRIVVEFIPEEQMRMPGSCGDWFHDGDTLHIRATLESAEAFGTEHAPFLVALHELVEAYLCGVHGVEQQAVDDFDAVFDEEQRHGDEDGTPIHGDDDEPGDDPQAPYRDQHRQAMLIEHLMANFLGVTDYGVIR